MDAGRDRGPALMRRARAGQRVFGARCGRERSKLPRAK